MPRAAVRLLLLGGLALVGFSVIPAAAYEEAVHALLDERAYSPDLLATPIAPMTVADLDALRGAIWRAGANDSDGDVKRRFLVRYPSEAAFDAWAFKDFLGLRTDVPIYGIDELPATAPATLHDLLPQAAREPDDDRRNQDVYAHDRARQVRLDPYGKPLPADPRQLDMGPLSGSASQAYAHYGLPRLQFSDDPDVLEREPRRFAYPPTATAMAADFAQEDTDLAICAATLGTSGGIALGWLLLGNSHHYLQDVANQIHTLQAIYGFFFDAKLDSYKEELWSLGGLLRARPDFVDIAVHIIENHHSLVENLWSKRVLAAVAGAPSAPEVTAGLAAITTGDAALERALDARKIGLDGEWARAITDEVIDASSREGGDVYEAIRGLAIPSLSQVGGTYDGAKDDPDSFIRKDADPAVLRRFYQLESAGFARAGSALRRDVRLFQAVLAEANTGEEARHARFTTSAQRLVKTQLALLEAREERLARFVPRAPRAATINWFVPGALLALLVIVVGGPTWLIRRRRGRRRSRTRTRD